jgi:hypothetical protein
MTVFTTESLMAVMGRVMSTRRGGLAAVTVAEIDMLMASPMIATGYDRAAWRRAHSGRMYPKAKLWGVPFIVVDLPPAPWTRVDSPA